MAIRNGNPSNKSTGLSASDIKLLTEQIDILEKPFKAPYTEALVFTLSSDGTYYSVGDDSTVGAGLDTTWEGGDLIIPDMYEGLPVTYISKNAFQNINNMTSIYIPDSITSISISAFTGCTSLENISIGDNLFNWEETTTLTNMSPFSDTLFATNNSNLRNGVLYLTSRSGNTRYVLKASADSVLEEGSSVIVSGAMQSHTSAVIPSSVHTICSRAFKGFSTTNIKSITFNHTENDVINLPAAGSSTGMLYSKNAATVTIYHRNNPTILNYDYVKDNLTPTFINIVG